MPEWAGVILGIYGIGGLIALTAGTAMNVEALAPREKRAAARVFLSAPVWPFVLAWLALKYVPRWIGGLFRDAFGASTRERDDRA